MFRHVEHYTRSGRGHCGLYDDILRTLHEVEGSPTPSYWRIVRGKQSIASVVKWLSMTFHRRVVTSQFSQRRSTTRTSSS